MLTTAYSTSSGEAPARNVKLHMCAVPWSDVTSDALRAGNRDCMKRKDMHIVMGMYQIRELSWLSDKRGVCVCAKIVG